MQQRNAAEHYKRSVLMIIAGGICLSLLGIGVRMMDGASSTQIVFFRSLSQGLFLTLIVFARNPGNALTPILAIGKLGWLAASLIASASLFMVLAVRHTTVANAVFIMSLAPLASALLGKLILHEQVTTRTWACIVIAILGIGIIVGGAVSGGGLLGMSFALLMVLFYSGSLVTIRSQSGADMIALCAVSGFILALAVSPFVESFAMSSRDLLICAILGSIQIGLGMVLIYKGAQHVPTAQVAILALTEVVLGPIWVWIGVGEIPSFYSLLGGSVVLFGVILQTQQKQT